MPQDEYDHSEVLDEWLEELGVSLVYTNFEEASLPLLYWPLLAAILLGYVLLTQGVKTWLLRKDWVSG